MLIFLFLEYVYSSFISSSTLDSCLNTGNTTFTCQNKLVVTLSIENNQISGAESLEATITSVSSDNSTSTLLYPLKIALQKSAVTARYPLNYLQDFNNKAQELLIASTIFNCDDGAESTNPTCGWKYDDQGNRIWDSQGYCCTCDLEDFLGINSGNYERGFACEAFNLGSGSSTAFCLVWDSLWYSSYQILQYQISYTISIQITTPDINGNYTTETYSLSPSVREIDTPNALLTLIGDFSPSSPPPTFDSAVLFTASRPPSHYMVQVGSPYWMAIDTSMISFDGTQCNKVGTSYTGFNGQPNKCNSLVGSCFGNQLDDLHSTDTQRQSNNERPLYFISRYGNFSMIQDPNTRYLELQLTGSYPSMITLELDADSLQFITSVSKGVIDYANITNFQSLTLDGTLIAQISNIGNVAAEFSLSILCSSGVSPISAQPVSLGIMQSKTLSFNVYVISNSGGDYTCNATLYNSIGQVTDVKAVYFNTTATQTNQGSEGGTGNTPNGATSNNKTNDIFSCSDYCPEWYNVPCFLVQSCWSSILTFFGIIIVLVVVLILIKFIIRKYGICCQKCCPSKRSRRSTPRRDESSGRTSRNIDNRRNEISQQSTREKKIYYLNSVNGCPSMKISSPISIQGTLNKKSGQYQFVTFQGKVITLSKIDVKKYISLNPKYKVLEQADSD